MPSLNGEQFGEQLRLFDAPASKVRSQEPEPRYAQLHLPFPVSPPPARKINWHTPMTQDRWNAHLRMDRSLGGRR